MDFCGRAASEVLPEVEETSSVLSSSFKTYLPLPKSHSGV